MILPRALLTKGRGDYREERRPKKVSKVDAITVWLVVVVGWALQRHDSTRELVPYKYPSSERQAVLRQRQASWRASYISQHM